MRKLIIIFCIFCLGFLLIACGKIPPIDDDSVQAVTPNDLIIDHTSTALSEIPVYWLDQAKDSLHIAYGHTSHGSQLVDGMSGLVAWKGTQYSFNSGGSGGALDLREDMGNYSSAYGAYDLNNPSYSAWATATRTYLSSHPSINVVVWSWCSGADTTTANIELYLSLMSQLETDYPDIKFVYMTGHLAGTGLSGNLHLRNEQIRKYCRDNNKILYDFEDIESYDPDGTYYGDKTPNDNCDYDSDDNGSLDKNWALDWQASHVENTDWYSCGSAHSQPLNANQKAYAAWWLWARLAGWSGN